MTAATSTRMSPALPPPNAYLRRFTVAEYHWMIDAGILTENDPVELLEGWMIYKMPRNPRHDSRIEITRRVVERSLPAGWSVRDQKAITLSDSEPEPDLVVALGVPERYEDHHPGPAEIALVVEVANTTLDFDRSMKVRVYSHSGIPVYWIVNLVDRHVECYTDPTGPDANPAYRQRVDYRAGDSVPLQLPGQPPITLAVQDFLP